MKNFLKFLFSGLFMGMLLIVFAISMGYATFIENDFDATTAKAMVYHSWWFKGVMVIMVLNFSGMIFTKKLYIKTKWNILIIHVALIVIMIGAGITHYLGYEGQIHIRENQVTDRFVSADPYFYAIMNDGDKSETIYKKVWLTPVLDKAFHKRVLFQGKEIELSLNKFMPNMVEKVVHDETGSPIVTIIAAMSSGRKAFFLRENESVEINGIPFEFGSNASQGAVRFQLIQDSLFIASPLPLLHNNMHTSSVDTLVGGRQHIVKLMDLYQVENVIFVFKEINRSAKVALAPSDDEGTGVGLSEVEVSVNGESKTLNLEGGPGVVGRQEDFSLGGVNFSISVGASLWQLPFSLQLDKFILDRYPGSSSPSSFASEITLIDQRNKVNMPYKIFMNNILSYRGFRFYQSSYDNDEKGTILSVNHDRLGTIVTYVGYFLLMASLFASLFTRKTRFTKLSQLISEVHQQRKQLVNIIVTGLVTVATVGSAIAQGDKQQMLVVDKDQAASFGELLTQRRDGRIVPVNTVSSELLRKIYKKNSYEGLSADQVMLGMMLQPAFWRNAPLIKVYDEQVQNMLGISTDNASWEDFFNEKRQYKLREQINKIYEKPPALRSKLEKELVSVDERLNVFNMALSGGFLMIFPLPGDPGHRWTNQFEFQRYMLSKDSVSSVHYLSGYLDHLKLGVETGDYQKAEEALYRLKKQQEESGKAVLPAPSKISLEIFYNKANIFYRAFPIFLTLGMVLLALFLLQLFWPSLEFPRLNKIFLILLWIMFVIQTLGLAIRWYISGHAPWSNGYESMIYIAWAVILAGLVLRNKSTITLALTSILAGITLLTAHMSWLNPEITNLVPVLKSYWLTFHVATITASYGFFGLASLMGFLNLSLMIFRNSRNVNRINLTIKELTFIIEMAMFVGLVLLTIGNFLGGVWANESWGRYWGWDPKETWSLITIIVYTFVLHLRLIPSMKNLFTTNFGAMFGFGSVLMTYFGVNYYLSGLHSYAQGDPVPVPDFVFYVLVVILAVSVLAAFNSMRLKPNELAETTDN